MILISILLVVLMVVCVYMFGMLSNEVVKLQAMIESIKKEQAKRIGNITASSLDGRINDALRSGAKTAYDFYVNGHPAHPSFVTIEYVRRLEEEINKLERRVRSEER